MEDKFKTLKNYTDGGKKALPVLKSVCVQDGKMIATNLIEIFIASNKDRIEDGLYRAVNNKLYKDNENNIIDYPSLPKLNGELYSFYCSFSKQDINLLKNTVSKDAMRVVLAGVVIYKIDDKINFIATDGYKLIKIDAGIKEENINIVNGFGNVVFNSDKLLKNIKAGINYKITIYKNYITFTDGDSIYISRLIDGSYPIVENILPKKEDINDCYTYNRKDFINALTDMMAVYKEFKESQLFCEMLPTHLKNTLGHNFNIAAKQKNNKIDFGNTYNILIGLRDRGTSFGVKLMLDIVKNIESEYININIYFNSKDTATFIITGEKQK